MARITRNRFQQQQQNHGGFLPRRINVALLIVLVLMVVHLMQSSITDPPKAERDSIGIKSPKTEDNSGGPSYKQIQDMERARMENVDENGEVEGDDDGLESVEFLKGAVADYFQSYHDALAEYRDDYLSIIQEEIDSIRPDVADLVDGICGDKIPKSMLPRLRNTILSRLDSTTMAALRERHQFHLQEEAETTHDMVSAAEDMGLSIMEISDQLIDLEETVLAELDEVIEGDMRDIAKGLYEDMLAAAQFIIEELFDNLGTEIDLVIEPEGLELVEYDGGKEPIAVFPAEEVEEALSMASVYVETEELLDDDMLLDLDDDFYYSDLRNSTNDEYMYTDDDGQEAAFDDDTADGDDDTSDNEGDDDDTADEDDDTSDNEGDDDDTADGDDDTSDNEGDDDDTADGDDDTSDNDGDDDQTDNTEEER